MGLFNLFKPAAPVLVVDVVALNESLGMKGNVAPRNQLQTLRRLARFSQREKIEVVAVACGNPLNKAPSGSKFEGIVILYSASAEDHPKYLAKMTRSKGAGAILISGNAEADKLVGNASKTMRVSTFRKAFETGGDVEPQERERPTHPGRPNRPNRNRRPKQAQNEEAQEPRQSKELSEVDAINELIDLVD